MHVDNPPGGNEAAYRVGWDLDPCGRVGGWGGLIPVGAGAWIGDETQGAGIAIGSILRGSNLDLVMFHVDNQDGANHGWYRIGRRLDASGVASKGWTDRIQVGTPSDWWGDETQGADVALADLNGTGRPDLIVFWINNQSGENDAWYRIGWQLDPVTGIAATWTDPKQVPGWFGFESQGAGIAVADVNGSGVPDLIVLHVNNEDEGNRAHYRIGWGLSGASGDVTGGWTGPMPISGWVGDETAEAALAVTDLEGSGRQDLVVMHVDNPSGPNSGHYRIGRNLDVNGRLHRP